MDSVSIELEDDIDVSRGDVLVLSEEKSPMVGKEIKIKLCWFSERGLNIGGKYVLLHNTNETICILVSIDYKIDINSLNEDYNEKKIMKNDICRVNIKTYKPLIYERYCDNRLLGSVILVDMVSNETVGAGMIE
jgi:sulfate adenylyltransferase subunit 1